MATQKSEQFWQRHVEAWRASGLTQKQYSKRHGLTTASLSNWSSVLQRRARTKPGQSLVPVRVIDARPQGLAIDVQHGAWRIAVPVEADPRWVATLLREMTAC